MVSPNASFGGLMSFVLQPWQLLVVILTGWLNRQQQAVMDFLLTSDYSRDTAVDCHRSWSMVQG